MADSTALVQGDQPTFRFTILNPPIDAETDGDPFDLTDYDVNFFIKRSLQDSDDAAEFNGTLGAGVVLGFTLKDGIVDVTIPVAVTNNLRYGRLYPFYLALSHPGIDTSVFIPARGNFLATLPSTN